MSQAAVAWLMLAGAMFLLAGGLMLRAFVGRRADRSRLGRVLRRVRITRFGRLMFGRVHGDALEPEELDQMILMPVIVVACGICLTALFLLGYVLLAP